MGVRVPKSLRSSANELDDAESVGRKHSPHEHVGEIKTALPDSESAAVAASLKTTWKTRFKSWSDDVASQATSLRSAADNWDEADQAATDRARRQRQNPYLRNLRS